MTSTERNTLMHGPPPSPDEIQGRLWRHVRHSGRAGSSYREAVLRAADDLGLPPFEVAALLGDPEL